MNITGKVKRKVIRKISPGSNDRDGDDKEHIGNGNGCNGCSGSLQPLPGDPAEITFDKACEHTSKEPGNDDGNYSGDESDLQCKEKDSFGKNVSEAFDDDFIHRYSFLNIT